MTFEGMDVGEVDRLAAQLKLQAAAVDAIVSVIDAAVAGLGAAWSGDDLHVFNAVWHQTHKPKATALSGQLEGWVSELQRQVAQQRATSGEGAGGGGGLPGEIDRGLTAGVGFAGGLLTGAVSLTRGVYDTADEVMGSALVVIPSMGKDIIELGRGLRLWNEVGGVVSNDEFDSMFRSITTPNPAFDVVSKSLGVFGAVLGGYDLVKDASEGKYVDAYFDGVGVAMGVGAMVSPPPIDLAFMAGGLAVTVEHIAYDHRKEIVHAIQHPAETAEDVVKTGEQVARATADVASDVGDAVSSVWHALF